jgi:hypothetical protein
MLVAGDEVGIEFDFKLTSELYEMLKRETSTQVESLTVLGAMLYFASRGCGLNRADLMKSISSVMDQVEWIDRSRSNVTPTAPSVDGGVS